MRGVDREGSDIKGEQEMENGGKKRIVDHN